MRAVGGVLYVALWLFLLLLVGRLVMDYVQMFARSWQPRGAMLVVLEVLYSATDPPLRALRRVMPPLRFGGIAFDLSFLVLWLIVLVLIQIVRRVFGI
ncbi:MAG: YggT family protein [Actinomycetota bacterium]